MFKNVLESISGVEIYPIISMILFIIVFCGMLIWAFRKDRNYLSRMAEMPLDDEQPVPHV